MCEIAINTSSHQGQIEIEISGTCAEFASVTKQLNGLSTGIFPLKDKPDTYYPAPMSHCSIETVAHSNGLITARIEGAEFKLSGDAQALRKLTDFLASLSNLAAGEHFHVDWFANEDLLAPVTADMSFIFHIEAEA